MIYASCLLDRQVVLAVNGGVLDLVLNFLCSARRLGIGGHGRGGDVYRSMLAFAGDDEVERAMVKEERKMSDEIENAIKLSCDGIFFAPART